ncbi:MAG: DUF3592 domain-containing protein [Anaerolineales bacterium]|nr:DUF3592 domain-containing protein [Anaerolineales bacterium]
MAKKKYSINWDDDIAVSFEVDGVTYESLEDVPEEKDRLKLEAMLNSAEDAEFDAEFEKIQKELEPISNFPVEKVVLSVFTGIAVIMLLVAGVASFNNIRKVNREESASGVVTDMTKRLEYDEQDFNRVVGETYYPVVEFTANDGKRRNVQLSEGSFPPAYEVGDEVTILYEPENPMDARIKSFGSSALMWILPSITGVLGIGFLVAVIAVQRVMTPSGNAQSE